MKKSNLSVGPYWNFYWSLTKFSILTQFLFTFAVNAQTQSPFSDASDPVDTFVRFADNSNCMANFQRGRSGSVTEVRDGWGSLSDQELLNKIGDLQPDVILVGEDHGLASPRTTNGFISQIQRQLPRFNTFFVETPQPAFDRANALPADISLTDLVSQTWASDSSLSRFQRNMVVQTKFRIQNARQLALEPVPVDSTWLWQMSFDDTSNLSRILDSANCRNRSEMVSLETQRFAQDLNRHLAVSAPGMDIRNCNMAQRIVHRLGSNNRGIFIVGAGHLNHGSSSLIASPTRSIQELLSQAGLRVLVL